MKQISPDRNAGASLRALFAVAAISALPIVVFATGPQWWTDRALLNPSSTADDYALANQGQAKNAASLAFAELQANLPGGAGTNLTSAVLTLSTASNNYVPINVGQLKMLAKPFYDRLIEVGYTTNYPWTGSTNAPNDYAPANIGQLKNLFSFDVTYDSDTNSLPDWWETRYFGHLGNDASANPDGNGLTLLQDYQEGNDPTNYFSQGGSVIVPTVSIVSGDGQTNAPATFAPLPLLVQVSSNGSPLTNAPVAFSIQAGGGGLATTNAPATTATNSLSVVTDAAGHAFAYFQQPTEAATSQGGSSQILALSGSVSVLFTEISTALDSDGDGMPDWWEIQYGLDPAINDAALDADGDGVTNLQEFLNGTSPMKNTFTAPYSTGFEVADGFTAGVLAGQQGWRDASSAALIQATTVGTGTQAVSVPGVSDASRNFYTLKPSVTVQGALYLSSATPFDNSTVNLPQGVAAIVSYDPSQGVMALNGNGGDGGTWTLAPGTLLNDQWATIAMVEDYSTQTWSLQVNGQTVLTGLGFKSSGVSRFVSIHVANGDQAQTLFDDIAITAQ